ncbi:hypothetical protein N8824_06000 [Candidatus Pelagibacter sp.]|nr:hypothetical protein [Candidatus Pelagibacter sp.]
MKQLITFLKNFKRTLSWKFIIENLFFPFYHFLWSYLINFKAKILYFLWILKKKNYFDFSDNDKLLISENNYFKEIANKILKETNYLKEDAKKKLFDLNYAEKVRKSNSASGELPYQISLYEGLSPQLKKEIVAFASSDKMITTACHHMKIFPILTRVQVSLNIPRENSKLRSAMLWHKDGFGFKNLDFFMTISDVDENSGPFFCVKNKIKAGIFKSFDYFMTRTGERNKVTLENFDKQFKDIDLIELKGKSGTGIFLDSFSVFHRGGFCRSKDRIMLRFCYQSHDAFCENFFINTDEFIYDESITKNNTKDVFKNFIFFKKPSTFIKLLSKKLLKFYSLIEYKYKI